MLGQNSETAVEFQPEERHSTDVNQKIDLNDFISGESFWVPDSMVESAWLEHAPFAFWLVAEHHPRLLVELGTHKGYSYLAFNQAIKRLAIETRCFAVDTWKGDEHSGFYGFEVFEQLRDYHDCRYGSFSQLMRLTFDEAVSSFQDASIDLLHIDGRHFYQDVRHDFETWRSKLSDRAVVVFHDTCFRENNFGVFRLWEELRTQYPYFEFLHGHGLGVLGVGKALPDVISSFFAASADSNLANGIREVYNRLGSALTSQFMSKYWQADAQRLFSNLAEKTREGEQLRVELAKSVAGQQQLQAEFSQREAERQRSEQELARKLAERSTEGEQLKIGLAKIAAERHQLQAELSESAAERQRYEQQLAQEMAENNRLQAELADRRAASRTLEAELAQKTAAHKQLELQLKQRAADNRKLTESVAEREQLEAERAAEYERLRAELTVRTAQMEGILSSTSWRLSTVIRTMGQRLPWLKKTLGRSIKGGQ
jgi:hypothetical protein